MEELLKLLKITDNWYNTHWDAVYRPFLVISGTGMIYLTWMDLINTNRFYGRVLIGELDHLDQAERILIQILENSNGK